MTDFLTRLAERTLGLTPRVEPLLTSRYAPGPVLPVFPEAFGEEQASALQTSPDPAQAPRPVSAESPVSTWEPFLPRAVSETQATSRTARAVAKESVAPDEASEPAAGPAPVLSAAMPETHANSRTTTTVAKASLTAEDTPGFAASSAESVTALSAEAFRGRPSRHVRQQPVANPDRRGEPATAGSLPASVAPALIAPDVMAADTVVPANQSVRHLEEPHAASLLLAPAPHEPSEAPRGGRGVLVRPVVERAAPRAETAGRQPAATAGHAEPIPPTNESGPPAVRVTIGRIEVRAVMPPTQATERPAPARSPPVLSLDDYLKQQSEAKR